MILIFDLDDTLYDESRFVDGGLAAVARMGKLEFGWNEHDSLAFMRSTLQHHGRGAIFDRWLAKQGKVSRRLIDKCIRVYRYHATEISLPESALSMLRTMSAQHSLYLVTDGHKLVQQRKIEALGLNRFLKRAFITNRYGSQRAKPSTYCFERIRNLEACQWSDMVYVGDNPTKDFVNLNKLGVHTIRVMTGAYRQEQAALGYEACHRIRDLSGLESLIARLSS